MAEAARGGARPAAVGGAGSAMAESAGDLLRPRAGAVSILESGLATKPSTLHDEQTTPNHTRTPAIEGGLEAFGGPLPVSVPGFVSSGVSGFAGSSVGVPAGGELELGRAQVVPHTGVGAWTGAIAATQVRNFEVRRVRLGGGECESRLVVRVFFDARRAADGGAPTSEQVREVAERARRGVDRHYNGGSRLPSGDLLRVVLEVVDEREDAHHVVNLHSALNSTNYRNWPVTIRADVAAHEVGHLLGLDDEYRKARLGRPVYDDGGLMGSKLVDGRGRTVVDKDRIPNTMEPGRGWIAPRYLRQLGAAVDRALGGKVFSPRDALAPRGDGLPAQASFSLDTRRGVLYGDARTGRLGLLPPRGMSSRPRPERVGDVYDNGTFRVAVPAAVGTLPGPRSETGSLERAGDIAVLPPASQVVADDRWTDDETLTARSNDLVRAVRLPGRPTTQVAFPEYWTEDDAVYAAEQAYLHALRNNKVVRVPGGVARYTWVGEYGGVRIEGELSRGEFTGFRPSRDQSGLRTPVYVPAPETVTARGPAFGQRVEDITASGDRRTRRGAHHPPAAGRVAGAHGMWVSEPVARHDNGTYRADVYFLDPTIRQHDPMADLRSRWRLHADGPGTVMFPAQWSADEVLNNVGHACAIAEAAGRIRRVDDRTWHWVGEVKGVRIEGLVRDGQHVVYRPTTVQPYLFWPEQPPVTGTATYSLGVPGWEHLRAQQMLFANGQRGVLIGAHVHLVPEPGTHPDTVLAALSRLEDTAADLYNALPRADDTPLVQVVLVHADQPEAAARAVPLGPEWSDEAVENEAVKRLVIDLVGIVPDPESVQQLARFVTGIGRNQTWLQPPRTTPQAGLRAIRDALVAGDVLAGPTTLREPDPTDLGTVTQPVPTLMDDSEVEQAFAPETEVITDAKGNLPPGWSGDDLFAAAFEVYAKNAAGAIDPTDPRFKIVWDEAGETVVEGVFKDVAVTVDIRNDRIVTVHATPTSDPANAPAATAEPAPDAAVTTLAEFSPEPVPARATGPVAADPRGSLGIRKRVESAWREWNKRGPDAVRELQKLLEDSGAGSRSLVIVTVPGEPRKAHTARWAGNYGGKVRWQDNKGQKAAAPQAEPGEVIESIDLDPQSQLIRAPQQLKAVGPKATSFCSLTPGMDLTPFLE